MTALRRAAPARFWQVREVAERALGNLSDAEAPRGGELEAMAQWNELHDDALAQLTQPRQRGAVVTV